jgi:hypothetical protein
LGTPLHSVTRCLVKPNKAFCLSHTLRGQRLSRQSSNVHRQLLSQNTMSDDGFDGGGVGDDYDYGGGYVSLIFIYNTCIHSFVRHEVIKRRHSYVISTDFTSKFVEIYHSSGREL